VSIDLNQTRHEHEPFTAVRIDVSETDWVHCKKEGAQFRAAGSPNRLEETVRRFLDFVGA